MEFIWPFGAFQKTNDPHKAIENLERTSAAATLWILGGILIEIFAIFLFPHALAEKAVGTIADMAIGFGLIVEYLVIGKVIDATKEAERESNDRIAHIEKQTAEANARANEFAFKYEQLRRAAVARTINLAVFVKELEGKPSA
jgi:hypothetical protein